MTRYVVMITHRGITGNNIGQTLVRVSYKVKPQNGTTEIQV
jgi:hypothetical protein